MTKISKPSNAAASGDLKNKLTRAGEEILETKGLAALTLRATARAAGVSHMAPYRHFDDKNALLASIAENGFNALTQAMEHGRSGEISPELRLLGTGIAYVGFAHDHPGLYRLMFSFGIKDKDRFQGLIEAGDAAFAVCSGAVAEDYAVGGKVSEEMIVNRSIAIWALVHGLSHLVIDGTVDLPEDDAAVRNTMIATILMAIR
jgi:AcrR family transcriptional regulator